MKYEVLGMFNFGTQELFLILIIALVIFGPKKLPEIGKAIGKSINEFKDAVSGDKKVVKEEPAKAETIDVDAGAKNSHKQNN